jgi:hypothetical protein
LSLAVTADDAPEGIGSLVTRAQRGEVAAFEALYRARRPGHGLCRRLIGDWHLAES